MQLVRNNMSISGDTLDVLENIAVDYPDIAQITKEMLVVMSIADISKIELTEEAYNRDLPKHIKIVLEGEKLMLEILPEDHDSQIELFKEEICDGIL